MNESERIGQGAAEDLFPEHHGGLKFPAEKIPFDHFILKRPKAYRDGGMRGIRPSAEKCSGGITDIDHVTGLGIARDIAYSSGEHPGVFPEDGFFPSGLQEKCFIHINGSSNRRQPV